MIKLIDCFIWLIFKYFILINHIKYIKIIERMIKIIKFIPFKINGFLYWVFIIRISHFLIKLMN